MIAKLKSLLVIGSEVEHSNGRWIEEEFHWYASIDADSEVGCIHECHVQCNS